MADRLRVAICAVGSELVLGDQVDTNSAWLSHRLREVGADVIAHHSAPDTIDELVPALRWLAGRADVLIVGGGLGPTRDDLTREAVAAMAGVDLRHRDDLEEALIQRFAGLGVRMPPSNLRQARLPVDAIAFDMLGTAPGFLLAVEVDGNRCDVIAMPGVPWEMQGMFDRDVLPRLLDRTGGGATVTRMVRVTGMGEASVGEALDPLNTRFEASGEAVLSYLAKKGEIQVRVTVHAATPDQAQAVVEPLIDEVVATLGPAVASRDGETLEQMLVRELASRGLTVAFAESATGGAVAARLASVAGASEVMLGGFVTYATDAKVAVAGVDQALVDTHGPVSEEVTRALAVAARERFGADFGVGVTGVAGPTEQDGKPVGTTTVAISGPGLLESLGLSYPGDRETVQRRMTTMALEALRRHALGD